MNNAGVEGPIADFHRITEDEWDDVLDINLKGAFLFSRSAIEQMLTQTSGGVLLHIASINAVEALAHMAPYNVSKAALVQLARSLAVEYLFNGIRSNAIISRRRGRRNRQRGTQDELARFVRGDDYVRPAGRRRDGAGGHAESGGRLGLSGVARLGPGGVCSPGRPWPWTER